MFKRGYTDPFDSIRKDNRDNFFIIIEHAVGNIHNRAVLDHSRNCYIGFRSPIFAYDSLIILGDPIGESIFCHTALLGIDTNCSTCRPVLSQFFRKGLREQKCQITTIFKGIVADFRDRNRDFHVPQFIHPMKGIVTDFLTNAVFSKNHFRNQRAGTATIGAEQISRNPLYLRTEINRQFCTSGSGFIKDIIHAAQIFHIDCIEIQSFQLFRMVESIFANAGHAGRNFNLFHVFYIIKSMMTDLRTDTVLLKFQLYDVRRIQSATPG